MKRFKFGITLTVAVLATVFLIGQAQAQKPVVRPGSDLNGMANPHGCKVFEHADRDQGELHVSCLKADGKVRVRYRYLKEYGGVKAPAGFTANIEVHGGKCGGVNVSWRSPNPRTGRVIVPKGCYVHILSVRWVQHHMGVA